MQSFTCDSSYDSKNEEGNEDDIGKGDEEVWVHENSEHMKKEINKLMCRNPTLVKCGGEAQHSQSWGLGVLRDSRMFRVR